jgi:hypothetical protein
MTTATRPTPIGLAAFLALIPAGLVIAGPPDEERVGEVIASFPWSPQKGVILLPVTLGDRTYNFAIDTGSSISIFDLRLRPLLGEPNGDYYINGTLHAQKYWWPSARLGTMPLGSATPVACLDMGSWREKTGQEFSGIIGMDWLKSMAFRIDPDRGCICFLRGESLPPPFLSRGLPFKIERDRPLVKVDMADLGEFEFLIDTGFSGGAVSAPEDLPRLAPAHRTKLLEKGYAWNSTGTYASCYFELESLTIGEHRFVWPLLSEGRGRLLGLDVWSRFIATFDMPRRRLYLEKARGFGEPWVHNRSSVVVERKKDEIVVTRVEPDSPAKDIGLKAGDVILSIGDRPARNLTIWEIRRMFSPVGSSHRLRIRNELGESEMTLTIREH